MNAPNLAKKLVVGIAFVCVSAGYVGADEMALQEKLSKEIKIELRDVTIAEALEKIGQKADVRIVLSDEAVWKLPQGEATRLSVMMQGPLAESLTEMLSAFFMRYAVGEEEITIYPRPELDHVLGRPRVEQLELLRDVYTKPVKAYRFGDVQGAVNEALGKQVLILPLSVQQQVEETLKGLLSYFTALARTEEEMQSRLKPGQRFELPTPIAVAQLLDQIDVYGYDFKSKVKTQQHGRWCISSRDLPNQIPEIRVLSEREFREARLDQMVDVAFKDEKAEAVIQKLAARTGMELHISKGDPSWLKEKLSLEIQNLKLSQALRNVVVSVDGEIDILTDRGGIYIHGPKHRKEAVAKGPSETKTGDYVGKISIPMDGGKYYIEFMLREKDLTDELKKLWQEKMKQILKVPSLFDLAPAAEPQPTDKTQEMQTVY